MLAHHARQTLGATGARNQAQLDLGLTEGGLVVADHNVALHRVFAAAAKGVAVDCRDDRLATGHKLRGAVGLDGQGDGGACIHFADVAAGGEVLFAAGQHDCTHLGVVRKLCEVAVDEGAHVFVERVAGVWAVDTHQRHVGRGSTELHDGFGHVVGSLCSGKRPGSMRPCDSDQMLRPSFSQKGVRKTRLKIFPESSRGRVLWN
ncbi:hypothetical protein D3C71_1165980 [compost metagenome]